MRRTIGYVLFTLGALLIFLSPLLRFYTLPRVQKAPVDIYDRTLSYGEGRYLDFSTFQLTPVVKLVNVTINKADPQASNHDVVVFHQFNRTIDSARNINVQVTRQTFVMDRDTGQAVHCCGEKPKAQGYTLKLPFDTKKTTYPFYDETANKAFSAVYQREQTVEGLKTYVFLSNVPETLIDTQSVPGSIVGEPSSPTVVANLYYSATTTLWVEPTTGAIVRASQYVLEQLQDVAGGNKYTVGQTAFTQSKASARHTADRIRSKVPQLKLAQTWEPYYGPVIGVVLMVIGGLLVWRQPRRANGAAQPMAGREVASTSG